MDDATGVSFGEGEATGLTGSFFNTKGSSSQSETIELIRSSVFFFGGGIGIGLGTGGSDFCFCDMGLETGAGFVGNAGVGFCGTELGTTVGFDGTCAEVDTGFGGGTITFFVRGGENFFSDGSVLMRIGFGRGVIVVCPLIVIPPNVPVTGLAVFVSDFCF